MTNQNQKKLKVIDTTFYSSGFPTFEDPYVRRDNYISQIEGYISDGCKLVFVDGEEDSGKTTLLAEFAKKHSNETISVFFNPFNEIDYTIEFYCSNVVLQIKLLLEEDVENESNNIVGIEKYRQYIFNAQKYKRKTGKALNLVIDGLENKIKEKSDFIKDLIPHLPIDNFNIIITSNEEGFRWLYAKPKTLSSKSISLAGFTQHEISEYLNINESEINNDIYKVTKGFPGRLKTLKRLLQKEGYSLDHITSSTTYMSWIELDCSSIDTKNALNNVILSLLALTDKSFNIEEIAKICRKSVSEIEQSIDTMRIFEKTNKNINFLSNSYKKHYAGMLRVNRKKTQELLINYYSSDDTVASIIELTKLYADNSNWENLVAIVDDDYPSKVINTTGSSKIVNEGLGLGILAAQKLDKYTEMLKYSIEAGLVNELDNYLFWESEITARIAIKDFSGAIALAESAILKVDRLKLLSVIAKQQKELNGSVDEDLSALIQQLYNTIDLTSVGSDIYDIVSNLIYAIPQLAITILEKSSGNNSDNSINDWLVAKLSIVAIDSSLKEKEDLESSKKIAAVQNIASEDIKKLNKAITLLVGNYSGNTVLDEVAKIKDSAEKIRLLRLWLANRDEKNDKNDELGKVIEKALDEIINYSSVDPITFDTLREVSRQLPFVNNKTHKDKLYYRFLNIDKSASDLGLIRNKFLYSLNMFHTEYTIDNQQASYSIQKLLNSIKEVSDVLTRLEIYSEAYHLLILLNNRVFEKHISFLYAKILVLVKAIFNDAANHLKISEYVLKNLGRRSPKLALKIIQLINLERRRDEAIIIVLRSYLSCEVSYINFTILKELEKNIPYKYSKDIFYLEILERFSNEKKKFNINDLFYFFEKIKEFSAPANRVAGYVFMYKIVTKGAEWKKKYANNVEEKIISAWKTIEAEWDRIDIGFLVSSDTAKINISFAQEIFKMATDLKKSSWIDSSAVAYAYLNSLKLVIISVETLIALGTFTTSDEKILEDLMNRNPSEIERIKLWTELALRCHTIKNEEYAMKLNDRYVLPLIEGLIHNKYDLITVKDSLILVYLFNSDLATKYINTLHSEAREIVYSDICDYLLSKKSPYDHYELEDNVFDTSYNDLTKAVNLLSHLDTDFVIYLCVSNIAKAIIHKKSDLASPQISSLIQEIEDIVENKLPDIKNIQHEGYKIISKMWIYKAKKMMPNQGQKWQELIEAARLIPNKSDEVFVLGIMINEIPFEKISDGNILKEQIYQDILTKLKELPTSFEFLERVTDMTDKMYSLGRKKWKEVIIKAFECCKTIDNDAENYKKQKRIIDSIYRIDPDYAKELIQSLESGNNKEHTARLLKKHMEMLEVTSKIKKNITLEEKEKNNYRLIVGSIIEVTKSINSNKLASKKLPDASMYLSMATKLPLREMFPVYAYYLLNCFKTYKSIPSGSAFPDLHKENFRKSVEATTIIEILSARKKINDHTSRKFFIDEDFISNMVFNAGSRDLAFNFIKNWVVEEVEEFVIIADPYFRKEDLELIKLVCEIKSNLDIIVLGSQGGEKNDNKQSFEDHWKKISEDEPPFIDFTFCWTGENNNKPFHDRWILTKNSGLRIGTSIGSLGLKKDSEISVMSSSEALTIKENSLSELISKKKKVINNTRIQYSSFTL